MAKYETIDQLIDLYKSVYFVDDPAFIPIACATIISNRMPGDALWVMLVGPSSGGKSEVINATLGIDFVHQVSTLTTNTFLSGMSRGDEETSLLLRIDNGVITMKDFTSIISLPNETRVKVMGDLREVYDGHMTKMTGTGKNLEWGPGKKINLLAGTTDKIYDVENQFAEMGSRWLNFKMPKTHRKEMTNIALSNSNKIRDMRGEIQEAFTSYIKYVISQIDEDEVIEISDEMHENLINLSEFACRARSPVNRNFKGEMDMVYTPEMPMRMATQLKILAQTFSEMNGGDLNEEYEKIVYRVALDSIPKKRWSILQVLAEYTEVSTKALGIEVDFPTRVAKPWVEDLTALGVAFRTDSRSIYGGDMWRMKPEYRKLMQEFSDIKDAGKALDVDDAHADDPYMEPMPGTTLGDYGESSDYYMEPEDLEEAQETHMREFEEEPGIDQIAADWGDDTESNKETE